MKALGIASRLALLVLAVSVTSYFVGQFLYWGKELRLTEDILISDDPTVELNFANQQSSLPDVKHSPGWNISTIDEFSSNMTDAQQRGNGSASGDLSGDLETKSGTTLNASTTEQNPNPNVDPSKGLGRFSSNETGHPLHEDLKRDIWEVPPAGSVSPSLEDFVLRKELIDFRAKKNVIIVTFANHAFMDFVLTFVKSLTDNGVDNILVGAMDTQLLEALYRAGIPTFHMGSNMKTFDVGWGSADFNKMGREKVILVNAFLALGYEVLMCDTDIAWLRNPLPFIERFPEADVLTSSDALINTVDDERLEVWNRSFGSYNIGIDHWRPTAVNKKFVAEWMKTILSDDLLWDQLAFDQLMRRVTGPIVDESSGLYYAYDHTLKLGTLPVSLFCSGHTFFVQALYKELGLKPYAIHTTFQFSGTEGKRHRLREAKVFYDPPDYYSVPGGYISYTPSLPENLMNASTHTVESHFDLVNHQLLQVRSALAIASILNRTLVMPELWCRFDRFWFGHTGIMPGNYPKEPFLCPMDHIFNIKEWLKDMPEGTFGPAIRFREYSFLDNPRLPSEVKASTLKVDLCELGTPGCHKETSKPPVPGVLLLPVNSTEDQLKASFSPFAVAQVIEFSSMIGAFGGFSDESRGTRFSNRVKTYTDIWCCVQNVVPGHILYDIYWDTKPGWKPKPVPP